MVIIPSLPVSFGREPGGRPPRLLLAPAHSIGQSGHEVSARARRGPCACGALCCACAGARRIAGGELQVAWRLRVRWFLGRTVTVCTYVRVICC
jgi:hypothetical protein